MIFPNRENIDRWLFDYTEGNLSSEQETLLENYILNNPDLEVDLESWQDAKVQPAAFEYKNQDELKKRRKVLPFYIIGLIIILVLLKKPQQILLIQPQQHQIILLWHSDLMNHLLPR